MRRGRPPDRRPPSLERNPLVGAQWPEPDPQAAASAPPPRRRKRPHVRIWGLRIPQFLAVTLIPLLLLGLLYGAHRYFDRKFAQAAAAEEEQAPARKPAVKPAPKPPARPVHHAATPVEAVRLMVSASLNGDRQAAYDQWGIAPDDIGALKGGQELTVAEMVALAAARGPQALAGIQFELREQSGNTAQVLQIRHGVTQQVYSLRRVGMHWKLFNAAVP